MYAVIETGGKQLRVEEGSVIYVEKLEANENDDEFSGIILNIHSEKKVISKEELK